MFVIMSYQLSDVLKRCSGTASWFGLEVVDIKSVNLMDDTPLHTVCSWGEFEPVKILLEAGADVNARGDNGVPPLFNAVIGGNPKVVELLINYGANVNLKNDDNRSVFEFAQNINSSEIILDILRK